MAWEVYSRTFAVCLAVYFAILAVTHLLQPIIPDRTLRWATAFATVQVIVILLLSLYLLAVRAYTKLKNNIYDQLRPAMRDRVLALAFEREAWSSVVPDRGPARYVLGESIAHALAALKAPGRDRVAHFALEHGFVAEWARDSSSSRKNDRKQAILLLGLTAAVAGNTAVSTALHDKHAAVRIEACRALLTAGDPVYLDYIFRLVLGESLLARALLANDLKRHATYLLTNTVPSVLEKATDSEAARCFEILRAWKRALPSFDVQPWLSDTRRRSLWPLVFALLPYVSVDNSIEGYLASALVSSDLETQCAAATAAGRLNLTHLIPALSTALSQNKRFALASAAAIALMGDPGERHLENIVMGPDRNAAALAMEALEHVTVKPHE